MKKKHDDLVFAALGKELSSGRIDGPMDFSCSVPTRSPRNGYILVSLELSAQLMPFDAGVCAVVRLKGEGC